MSRSNRKHPFRGLSTCRLRLSYRLQAAPSLASTWFHLRADFPLASVTRSGLGACPCFPVPAIWAGHKPRSVYLSIIALWISGLPVWISQVVCGFWSG